MFLHPDVYSKKQQTIKVKVQSNQDVNEPVVKEAILEQVGEAFTIVPCIEIDYRNITDQKVGRDISAAGF